MSRYFQRGFTLIMGFAAMGYSWTAASELGPGQALAVVVHRSSAVNSLALADLRQMLTGDLNTWPDSSAVVLVEQPGESATQQRVLRVLLGTTPSGYNRRLLQAQFQGKPAPIIRVLLSDQNAIKFVWNVPGAIAVVEASSVAPAVSLVKVLRINGKQPGETGYPLQ